MSSPPSTPPAPSPPAAAQTAGVAASDAGLAGSANPAPQAGDASASPGSTGMAAAPRRRWRLWAALCLVPVALLALALWAWQQPPTLPWLLGQVPGLQAEGVRLQLSPQRLHIDHLRWQAPASGGTLTLRDLTAQGWRLRWRPHPGAWVGLHLEQVHVAQLRWTSGTASTPASAAPTQLRLPFVLDLMQLQVQQAQVDQQPPVQALRARLHLGDQAGALHHGALLGAVLALGAERAEGAGTGAHAEGAGPRAKAEGAGARGSANPASTPRPATLVGLAGTFSLGADGPLPVNLVLAAQSPASGGWRGVAQLQGPLARLQASLNLDALAGPLAQPSALAVGAGAAGTGASSGTGSRSALAPLLQAQATLTPWAAWPLQALQLNSRALDLNALSPDWPRTALTGAARVHTSGLNQPAQADIALDNARPARLDQHSLPLRRLQLRTSASLQALQALRIEQFQADLADGEAAAGTLRGSGQWQGQALDLALQLDNLQPARLHGAAAAMRLSGPLSLALQGLPLAGSAAPSTTSATPASGPGAAARTAAGPSAPATAHTALHWQLGGNLAGQLNGAGANTPALRLLWQAEGQPGQLLLREALASAGAAQAQATGQARWSDTGWHTEAKLQLTDFDPRPWWRGTDGSAWRRGPHRLAGQLDLDLKGPGSLANLAATPWQHSLASLVGQAKLQLAPSQLTGVPLQGSVVVSGQGGQVQAQGQWQVASNQVQWAARSVGVAATSAPQAHPANPGAGPARAGLNKAPGWQLDAQWQLPALGELAPWRAWLAESQPQTAAAWPRQGSSQGTLQLQRAAGAAPGAWASTGQAQVQGLNTDLARLNQADLRWQWGADDEAPLTLQLSGQGWVANSWKIDQLQARADGSRRQHQISLQVDSPLRPPAWTEALLGPTGTGSRLQWQAEGRWPSSPGFGTNHTTGTAGAPANAANATNMGLPAYNLRAGQLQWGPRDGQQRTPWVQGQDLAAELRRDSQGAWQQLLLAPGRLQLASTTALRWQTVRWRAGQAQQADQLEVDADLEAFDVARLLNRLQPGTGWSGNLTLGGRIQVSAGARLDADIVLERGSGDLLLTDELGGVQALGLSDLRLAFSAHDGVWQFAQGLAGSSIGTVVGAQQLSTSAQRRWPEPQAPLQGVLQARVGNLAAWGAWVPPGWRLAGALDVEGEIGGRFGAPELRGRMQGRQLAVRNLLEGVNLSDGTLDLALQGETARIDRFEFKGGDGSLVLTGGGTLGAQPSARIALQAERFRLLSRIDRRLVVSGRGTLQLAPQLAQLDGQLRVDEGLIDLSRGDAPTLDSDVRVNRLSPTEAAAARATAHRSASEPATPAAPPPSGQVRVQLALDLGERLRLQGQGIDTRLRGQLQITTPNNKLAVNGTVRTEDGRYAAYGQKLDIARGEAVFTGALDNPRLDILATRPNLDVVVGVAVTGSPGNPRVRLVSEPELSDYDKLSWLVLGRSPDGLGNADTALLQRAAIALLAGNETAPTDQFINALGLTDFSVRQSEGDTRDTIISLGKQLSRRWYVGYERGVNATVGNWQLVYRVAQRFTLRAQSGEDNAVDLIWSWRW